MNSLKFNILLVLLFSFSICSNQGEKIKINGIYVADYDVGGGTYRTTFTFADSLYKKEFYFMDEDELVWRCAGLYKLDNKNLIRKNRICEFLRSEEPQPPKSCDDIISTIKNITDSSFSLLLKKDENSVPDTTLWLEFIKTNSRSNSEK